MRHHRSNSGRNREQGIIITLVAIFMLFVMGAMAALSIDVVTFYTARSEAQLAADGAALAGARVLANSGMTSSTGTPSLTFPIATTEALATTVATQVARQNQVGGRTLAAGEVTVSYNVSSSLFLNNPRVTVQVSRNDLPTFFARIWGSKQITVSASATAEAYNPSGLANGTTISQATPVSPTCVKPWLLPNIDPTSNPTSPTPIFNAGTGAIQNTGLLGTLQPGLTVVCTNGDCSGPLPAPSAWKYYPGDTSTFPPPSSSSVVCSPTASGYTPTPYQLSVAGCVQTPIACNAAGNPANIDTSTYTTRDSETFAAVNCLTHSAGNGGDSVDQTNSPAYPFKFLAGADNPLVQAGALTSSTDVLVSDSLVTIPIFDCGACLAPLDGTTSVNIIGFVQLFLNPDGNSVPTGGPINATVINMVGCGTGVTGSLVIGNGASAVPVRLITPP